MINEEKLIIFTERNLGSAVDDVKRALLAERLKQNAGEKNGEELQAVQEKWNTILRTWGVAVKLRAQVQSCFLPSSKLMGENIQEMQSILEMPDCSPKDAISLQLDLEKMQIKERVAKEIEKGTRLSLTMRGKFSRGIRSPARGIFI